MVAGHNGLTGPLVKHNVKIQHFRFALELVQILNQVPEVYLVREWTVITDLVSEDV